jgi:hypothetical protein
MTNRFYWTENYEKNVEKDMIYCSDTMRDNTPNDW